MTTWAAALRRYVGMPLTWYVGWQDSPIHAVLKEVGEDHVLLDANGDLSLIATHLVLMVRVPTESEMDAIKDVRRIVSATVAEGKG